MIWLSQSTEFWENSSCISPEFICYMNTTDNRTPVQLPFHWIGTWYSSVVENFPSFVIFNFLALWIKNCSSTDRTIIYIRTAFLFRCYWLEILAWLLSYSEFVYEKQSIERISTFFTSSYTTVQKRLNWKHYIPKSIIFVVVSVSNHINNCEGPAWIARIQIRRASRRSQKCWYNLFYNLFLRLCFLNILLR